MIILISNDFALPVTASFLGGPLGRSLTEREVLWRVPIGSAVALFILLAAVDHLLMATPPIWGWYARNLRQHVNPARWWEYSVSASIMIVLIALVTGISDVAALIAIFGVNSSMILFGLLMETVNRDRQPVDWSPFLFGCIAGIVPWIIIG